jgi:hypothetical protein
LNGLGTIDIEHGFIFKSDGFFIPNLFYFCAPIAQVVKLVDTLSSGGSAVRCAGSNPVLGTKKERLLL